MRVYSMLPMYHKRVSAEEEIYKEEFSFNRPAALDSTKKKLMFLDKHHTQPSSVYNHLPTAQKRWLNNGKRDL